VEAKEREAKLMEDYDSRIRELREQVNVLTQKLHRHVFVRGVCVCVCVCVWRKDSVSGSFAN